jgi:hypothetical protein
MGKPGQSYRAALGMRNIQPLKRAHNSGTFFANAHLLSPPQDLGDAGRGKSQPSARFGKRQTQIVDQFHRQISPGSGNILPPAAGTQRRL